MPHTCQIWLSSVSLETTSRHAEVNLEMKAKTLQMCVGDGLDSIHEGTTSWYVNSKLMAFLVSL